jgi:ParB family chromosome partitioning protein
MQIIEAKLFDLKIDPANVRQTEKAPDEGLLASIRAKGLIVPLTVRKNGEGYYVTDGGKRLAALHVMARDGDFDKTKPISCVLREDDAAAAADVSLTTNFIREDMHPVDVYEAFANLRDGGKSTEDIAREYGLPIPTVRQHLALGALSPKVREAWKNGEFGDDDREPQAIAQIFTLAGGHAEQDAAYEKLKKQKRLTSEWQVREAIVGNNNEAGKLVAFVGVDAYKAAGGRLVEDLFGSSHRIEDPAIAKKLADEKLLAECQKAIGLGWSWAEPLSALPKGCEYSWQRAHNSVEQFPKTKRKEWGLALYVNRDCELDEFILQKPEQKKAADKAAKTKAAKKAETSGEAVDTEPTISQALNYKLSVTLTEAAANAITLQPDLAFMMGLAALMTSHGCQIKLRSDGHGSGTGETDWDFETAFAHVQKLTPKQRASAFAMCVGESFSFVRHQGNPLDPEHGEAKLICDAIDPKQLNKDLRDKFDALDYFNSASARIGLAAYVEMHGKGISAPSKKSELAEACAADARLHGWLPPELRTKHYDGPGSKGYGPVTKADTKRAAKPAAKATKKRVR